MNDPQLIVPFRYNCSISVPCTIRTRVQKGRWEKYESERLHTYSHNFLIHFYSIRFVPIVVVAYYQTAFGQRVPRHSLWFGTRQEILVTGTGWNESYGIVPFVDLERKIPSLCTVCGIPFIRGR